MRWAQPPQTSAKTRVEQHRGHLHPQLHALLLVELVVTPAAETMDV